MKILYYIWGENSSNDIIDTLTTAGHKLTIANKKITDYHNDNEFYDYFYKLAKKDCDCIFTFNYFPIISNIAEELKIPYISWIYDCPHYTLYSKTILNSMNRIYTFDKRQLEELKRLGCPNAYHQPLAAATVRLNSQLGSLPVPVIAPQELCTTTSITDIPETSTHPSVNNVQKTPEYLHDVSFVGSLYENGMYEQIQYLPPYINGYFEALIATQPKLQGINLANTLISPQLSEEVLKYVKLDFGNDFFPMAGQVLCDMLNAKITSNERITYLNSVADNFSLALYSASGQKYIPHAEFGGYIDYVKKMPHVFRHSKINLNISLRSITSGIPLRAIDIMAAGGFLLSNYQPELDEFFENGKDCVMYQNEDELLYYIHYYLNNEAEREEIAYNGWKKVNELYSYNHILPALLKF